MQVFKIFPYTNLSVFGVYCNASLLIPDTINLGLSFFWLAEPSVCQISFTFSENLLLGWLTLHYSLVWTALVSEPTFIISCHWLHLDLLCSWFSKCLRSSSATYVCSSKSFNVATLSYTFPYWVTISEFQRFCSHLSLSSRKIPYFFSLTHSSFSSKLFNFCEFVYLLEIYLLSILSFIALWSYRIQ